MDLQGILTSHPSNPQRRQPVLTSGKWQGLQLDQAKQPPSSHGLERLSNNQTSPTRGLKRLHRNHPCILGDMKITQSKQSNSALLMESSTTERNPGLSIQPTLVSARDIILGLSTQPTLVSAREISPGLSSQHTPVSTTERNPGISSQHTPVSTTERNPGLSSQHTLASTRERSPGLSSQHTLVSTTERNPGLSSQHTPVSTTERNPGLSSQHTPVSTTERNPGLSSQHTLVSTTERNPGLSSQHTPVSTTERNPGISSQHTPVSTTERNPGLSSQHTLASTTERNPGLSSQHTLVSTTERNPGLSSQHTLASTTERNPGLSSQHTPVSTSHGWNHGSLQSVLGSPSNLPPGPHCSTASCSVSRTKSPPVIEFVSTPPPRSRYDSSDSDHCYSTPTGRCRSLRNWNKDRRKTSSTIVRGGRNILSVLKPVKSCGVGSLLANNSSVNVVDVSFPKEICKASSSPHTSASMMNCPNFTVTSPGSKVRLSPGRKKSSGERINDRKNWKERKRRGLLASRVQRLRELLPLREDAKKVFL